MSEDFVSELLHKDRGDWMQKIYQLFYRRHQIFEIPNQFTECGIFFPYIRKFFDLKDDECLFMKVYREDSRDRLLSKIKFYSFQIDTDILKDKGLRYVGVYIPGEDNTNEWTGVTSIALSDEQEAIQFKDSIEGRSLSGPMRIRSLSSGRYIPVDGDQRPMNMDLTSNEMKAYSVVEGEVRSVLWSDPLADSYLVSHQLKKAQD